MSQVTIEQYADELRAAVGTVYRNVWSVEMFGPEFPGPHHAFNTTFNIDAIRKFVDALGDLNPLYRDTAYAQAQGHAGRLAPPTMLYSVAYGYYPNPRSFPPLPYFGSIYAGDAYEWYEHLREGDEIDLTTIAPTQVDLKETRMAGKVIFYRGVHEFRRRSDQQLLGRCEFTTGIRGGEIGAHRPDPPARIRHTPEYVAGVYETQDRETVHGAVPRYWEDVAVGEALPQVARGPFTRMEQVAWISAGIGERFFISDRLHRLMHRHNGRGVWNEDLSIYNNFHEATLTEEALGSGSQRAAWTGMMLTNWMGDRGFLRRLETKHIHPGRYGSVYWVSGQVRGKRVEQGRHLVDVACKVENHAGVVHLTGEATVALPSREAGG